MITKIRDWYRGTSRAIEFENDSNGSALIGTIYMTEHHWTARVAHRLVDFYFKNWQWLCTTALALAALIVSLIALRSGSA